jgi:hypothetical protein
MSNITPLGPWAEGVQAITNWSPSLQRYETRIQKDHVVMAYALGSHPMQAFQDAVDEYAFYLERKGK